MTIEKKKGRGRPRKLPVLQPDMFGQPLRKNDFILYVVPGSARTSLSVGRIIGKHHCYLLIRCLEDCQFYGMVHKKHSRQVYRLPPSIRQFLTDWNEDGTEVENNYEIEKQLEQEVEGEIDEFDLDKDLI